MPDLRVKIEGAEIRGVEEKAGRVDKEKDKEYPPYLIVRIDDEAGNRHELIDRDVENKKLYKRGTFCDIDAIVKYGYAKGTSWARFEIVKLTESKA